MMGKLRLELLEVVDKVTKTTNYLDILPFCLFFSEAQLRTHQNATWPRKYILVLR